MVTPPRRDADIPLVMGKKLAAFCASPDPKRDPHASMLGDQPKCDERRLTHSRQSTLSSLTSYWRLNGQIRKCLHGQLSAASACKVQGGSMHTRQKTAMRDALMGLGTVAFMCGDDGVACVNFERASKCCR